MTMEFVLNILGWVFFLLPIIIFLAISGFMVWGAGEDDGLIRTLSLLGIAISLMGAIILVIVNFSRFL